MQEINLNLKLDTLDTEAVAQVFSSSKNVSHEEIAIIGIDAKVGDAVTLDEIWQVFYCGKNMVAELSARRELDARDMMSDLGRKNVSFCQKAYLPKIDLFDPEFFNISQLEAELMDPAQRLFLESAWAAIEDSGYGGKRLWNSNTGVYVGYNSGGESLEYLEGHASPEAAGLIISGHVNSFLPSRLSYMLNLKGPAMIIDTACSSSLVAIHQACTALRNKSISMAIVGSVRVFLAPVNSGTEIGTTSSSGYTKTFDVKADGTGGGEGVITFVLKPLSEAITDHDHIYSVIKGSCINQDGNCIGLTAPNSAAQTEVLIGAWKDAGIAPEKISYIEAHGTATKLGDPIEIGALTEAFGRYTNKKQFCAIGAAKSNFGHLDCAAGMLGVLKVILMMRYKTIPPTIHFHIPNSKIDFIQSPIYVNDTAKDWSSEDNILTAGVSSFGLSGTNSHVVLQSFQDKRKHANKIGPYLLTVSARNSGKLVELVKTYQTFLRANPDVSFADFCFTINTGRGQYPYRFAGVFPDKEAFLKVSDSQILSRDYYFDAKPKANENVGGKDSQSDTEQQKLQQEAKAFCKQKNLNELLNLFLHGIDIEFSLLYQDESLFRISAPCYPFQKKRCWYRHKNVRKESVQAVSEYLHPLIDRCVVEAHNLWIFEKQVSVNNCLELREHRINHVHVIPGTAYVEMANYIWKYIFGPIDYTITDVTFFSLMSCAPESSRCLQAIAEKNDSNLTIRMLSRGENEIDWSIHVEVSMRKGCEEPRARKINIGQMLSEYSKQYSLKQNTKEGSFVQVGEHWNCGEKIYLGSNSAVLFAKLDEDLLEDTDGYSVFPALLDVSVNAGMSLLEGRYLPLHYKDAVFYSRCCSSVISRVQRENMDQSGGDIERFHVEMFDNDGNLIAEVKQYAIKRLRDTSTLFEQDEGRQIHAVFWRQEQAKGKFERLDNKQAVVVLREEQQNNSMLLALAQTFRRIDCLVIGNGVDKNLKNAISVKESEEEIEKALKQLKLSDGAYIISLLADGERAIGEQDSLLGELKQTFYLTKALMKEVACRIKLVIIAQNAGIIAKNDTVCYPYRRSIMAFASCLAMEQLDLELCIIDKDAETDNAVVIKELGSSSQRSFIGFRKNARYIECIERNAQHTNTVDIQNNNVVLIPGGYGGIGLSICEYFFEKSKDVKLILLSRTGISENPAEDRNRRLTQLKKRGCEIDVYKANVTDYQEVCNAVESIRNTYGRIDGVVFSAGLPGGGILQNETWEDEWDVIRVKSQGVQNVDLATRQDNVKFFVLFSSLTSLFGAGGQTAYAAANGFLDSYAEKRNLECGGTVVINWTGWSESGMAVNAKVNTDEGPLQFINNKTGRLLFEKALLFGSERIAVFRFKERLPLDYAADIQKRIDIPKEYIMEENKAQGRSEEEHITIYGKSPEKLTEIEKRLAFIWAKTLKASEINIYAKFFEIGGNSLLAAYLHKEVNKVFPNALDVTDVFAYSTVADMAEFITNKQEASNENAKTESDSDEKIEDLVRQFVSGELSIDEIEALI